MNRINECFCYYRVFRNDTAVKAISFNDFKPVRLNGSKPNFSLVADGEMYLEYESEVCAMEKAKEGALKYIECLIKQGAESRERLYQYRYDHYEDLNINLLDARIRTLEKLTLKK